MNYYISDLHLGHKNVIKFDNRPFADLNEMEEVIVKNWNNRIHPQDTVYILGDFIWNVKDAEWIRIMSRLKGNKVLILGNHDLSNMSSQLRNMFADVKPYKEISDGDKRVILCHYPIPFYRSSWAEHIYMLHGHVHFTREAKLCKILVDHLQKTSSQSKTYNRGHVYNVGCMLPYMNYTPRTLEEIINANNKSREAHQSVFSGLWCKLTDTFKSAV